MKQCPPVQFSLFLCSRRKCSGSAFVFLQKIGTLNVRSTANFYPHLLRGKRRLNLNTMLANHNQLIRFTVNKTKISPNYLGHSFWKRGCNYYSLCAKKKRLFSWNSFLMVNIPFIRLSLVKMHSLATVDICCLFSKNTKPRRYSNWLVKTGKIHTFPLKSSPPTQFFLKLPKNSCNE